MGHSVDPHGGHKSRSSLTRELTYNSWCYWLFLPTVAELEDDWRQKCSLIDQDDVGGDVLEN